MTESTLTEMVATIESNAERKRTADNVEDEVDRAYEALGRINSELEDLVGAVEVLQFYRELLLEAFDGTEPPAVQSALEDAEAALRTDREAIVRELRDGNGESVRTEIAESVDSVEDAKRTVKTRLREEHWSVWNERLASARELQRILDSENREFQSTLDWLESLVTDEMRNPDQAASSVVKQWDRAVDQWEDHQDLQGLSQFQEKYGISDDAVDTIKTLSQGSTTLAEVDVDVLGELKRVPGLGDAVTLEI